MNSRQSKGLIFTSVLTAIGASLCCITPVLALVAGSSSMASSFSWLEPLRPYLIAITIAIIGYAWYLKLRPIEDSDDCGCEIKPSKVSFMKSKSFLIGVTLFASATIAFPYYAHLFYPKPHQQGSLQQGSSIQYEFKIEGMTCQGCEEHIKHAVNTIEGTETLKVSYEDGEAIILVDTTRTTGKDVKIAIEDKAGYKVLFYE